MKVLQEYEEMDHAEPVPAENLLKPAAEVFYLPAHGVVKESSNIGWDDSVPENLAQNWRNGGRS